MPTIAKTPPALGWFAVLVDARLRLLNFADAKLPFAFDCVGAGIARRERSEASSRAKQGARSVQA